jgi:hypothetical protein
MTKKSLIMDEDSPVNRLLDFKFLCHGIKITFPHLPEPQLLCEACMMMYMHEVLVRVDSIL